ncbi:unnamed protein product [Ectocarpus sp. CCAP 1310/34]|nr:unnamed protein product [Ectocarpus sp. CCAP 1310/34]
MGSDCGSSSPLNLDGGSDEDSGDEGVGPGAAEHKRNAPGFVATVEQLLRMFGSIKYSVHVLAALSKDGERGSLEADAEIASLEDVCPKCGKAYAHLKSVRVTALVPGPDLVEAVLKINACVDCGVEAVTGDDWQEHGYFVLGETLLVHLSDMDATRRAVLSGTAISHAFDNLLRPLADNLIWMTRNKLAKRALTNNYLKKLLLDAYLAFEALTDLPYWFFSFIDGFFPLLSSFDGCAKLAVNICIEKYLRQRMEQVIDMDLDAIWLVISMLSPMVFGMRLQFSQNTPVTFCPQNRKSNIIVVPARGHAPRSGDAQAADGQKLMERVRENKDGLGLSEMLEGTSLDGLMDLYRLCFGPRAPGISRYPNRVLLIELFKTVEKLWRESNHGKEDCSKFFMERGAWLVSSGVEGGYSPDGVQTCHMFMLRAESPTDLAVLLLHHVHMPILVITDIMGRVGPIVHGLCQTAAPNKGVLPRVGEPDEHGMRTVDIPALAPVGNYFFGADKISKPVPQEKCTRSNVYNLLRDAKPSPAVQRLNFGQLLSASSWQEVEEGDTAVAFVLLARARLRNLRRQSHHSMDLFEVVAVLNVRLTKLVAVIREGQDKELPPTALVEEEQVVVGSVLQTLSAQSVFSTRVLAAATGSTTGKAPRFPAFSRHLCEPEVGQNDLRPAALDDLVLTYARAKEEFIASGRQPANERVRKRAGALEEDPTATVRRTHALGSNAGPYYGPDTLHDCNHGDDFRQKYGGIDTCAQLSGVNLNAHEQNHAKKKKFLHMLNVMKFDRFAFMVTLINETENEAINRRSVANMVKRVRGHGLEKVQICQAEVWFCGRCFCENSLMRSFDQFGRVRLTFIQS